MTALLHHLIDRAASRAPEAEAARCDAESLTYGRLAQRANGLSHVLVDSGLRPTERVAVLLGKGLDVPVAFYGALAAGGALVPIDPRSPAEQVGRILRATGATHLVCEPRRAELIRELIPTCPDLAHVVGPDDDAELSLPVTPWTAVAEAQGDRPPEVRVVDTDPAYVLHTSGSTGLPKLILHTHRSAMSFVDWAAREYELRPDDRLSNHSSHHTCFATFDYYAAARAGAATVILTPAVMMMPGSLSALLERERVSVWYSVPTALVHLSLRGDLEARDLSALRWVLFAGESFPTKHLERLRRQLPGARFSHVYGSTEVNVCTSYLLPADPERQAFSGETLPIGRACSTAATLVVDDQLRPLAAGETGELLVKGSTVMSGYWGDPDASRRALIRLPSSSALEDVYFRTGDRVRELEDGNLTFVARADFQVKIRGHRVELEEVEAALLGLEAVEEAAAFATTDGEASSSLRAAVVLATGDSRSPQQLRADLSAALPAYAIPTEITVLESLPRTPTGKVDRKALSGQPREGAVTGVG